MVFVPRESDQRVYYTQLIRYATNVQQTTPAPWAPEYPQVHDWALAVSDGSNTAPIHRNAASSILLPPTFHDGVLVSGYNALEVTDTDYEGDFEDAADVGGSMSITGPTDCYYWAVNVRYMFDSPVSGQYYWWQHDEYLRIPTTIGTNESLTRCVQDGGGGSSRIKPTWQTYFIAPTISSNQFITAYEAHVYLGAVFQDSTLTGSPEDFRDDANRAGENGNGPPFTANQDYWVAWVEVTNGGSGYTSEPTVTATNDLGGEAPEMRATINDAGEVVAIYIKDTLQASQYDAAPAITITGGGGSGAAATAHLSQEIYCICYESTPAYVDSWDGETMRIEQMTQPFGRDVVLSPNTGAWHFANSNGSSRSFYVAPGFIWGTNNGSIQIEWRSGTAPANDSTLRFYPAQVCKMEAHTLFQRTGGFYNFVGGVPDCSLLCGVGSAIATVTIPSSGTATMPAITAGTYVVPVLECDDGCDPDSNLTIHLPFDAPTPEYTVPIGRSGIIHPA